MRKYGAHRVGTNCPEGPNMNSDRSHRATQALSRLSLGVLVVVTLVTGLSGASAHAGFRKPSVLIVHAEQTASWFADVQASLNSSSQFASVDTFDANTSTPTLAQLLPYDAVLLFSDNFIADPATLGNNLADYVDAGGGVVNMAFSTTSFSTPEGRWDPGYLSIAAGGTVVTGESNLDMASISDQNHPILIGVGSFNGGTNSFRANQNSVVPGASVIARWTGGNVLVSAGPLPGRVDLNFFPVSNAQRSDFWDQNTDGVKLMVNALLYTMRPRVLIVAAEGAASWNDDVKTKIRGTGLIGMTDIFRADTATPTLAQLQAYDAALVYSDWSIWDPVALGNALADYVDAGGGVVTAVFVNCGGPGYRLLGRWAESYELIDGTFISIFGTATSLGTVTYLSHPAMSGVVSFNGGSKSYRPVTTNLKPGAFNVAQWSDGRPLVVASTKFHNRVDLGFFPPSSTVKDDFWQVGTDGDKLMANALLYTVKPYVACIASDSSNISDPVAKLAASRRFSGVASVDAQSSTPSAATLRPFNAVLVWSNTAFQNSTALGNNLADLVDAGGGTVTAVFGNTNFGNSPSYYPAGRWPLEGYDIVPLPLPNSSFGPQSFLGAKLEPANPINAFVRKFDGGLSSYRAAGNPLLRGREVLRWNDGRMLASVHNFKKRVDLGMYPCSSATLFGNTWNQRTDGTWLMANALEYAVRHAPCPGDFNGDGFVDDADFVLFAGYYDDLLDPRGDLTGDGLTEDSDFVQFAGAYNELICP